MATPLPRTKLTSQLFDALVHHIVSEGLRPGEALPSTAALSEQYGTSRPVVREALSALEAIGLVEVRSGRNAVVRELDGHLIHLFLARAIQAQAQPLRALMEVRAPLEVQAARLAANRGDQGHKARIQELLAEMAEHLRDAAAYPALDVAFHMAIARSTGNRVLIWVTESIRAELMDVMVKVRVIRERAGLVGDEQQQHEEIANAIRRGDPEEAARAMAAHMESSMKLIDSVEADGTVSSAASAD